MLYISMLFYNGNDICYTINFGMIKIFSDLFYYLGVVEGTYRSSSSDSSVLVSQTNSGSSTSGSSSESDARS